MTMNIAILFHYPYFEVPDEMNKQERQTMMSPIYQFKIIIKRKKGGRNRTVRLP